MTDKENKEYWRTHIFQSTHPISCICAICVALVTTPVTAEVFQMEGLMVVSENKTQEGKCGVGRCGANKPEKEKEDVKGS